MKIKKMMLPICLAFFTCLTYAQRVDTQEVFVATSEEEVFRLYNQMLDSARLFHAFMDLPAHTEPFSFGFLDRERELEGRNTILKFAQDCRRGLWNGVWEYRCDRFYWMYISNSMPVDFYGRFLSYLEQLDVIENYFIKHLINRPLFPILEILIKQYEQGKLNEADSIKARILIEETMLRLINDMHDFFRSTRHHKYVTDNVRQALINALENPFYPTAYLEFYMSQQNTSSIDTVGIAEDIMRMGINSRPSRRLTEEEFEDYFRAVRFASYQRLGEEWGGLSAEEAYLERKRREFRQQGFLPINSIARYAHEVQDELLIKHLKEFKKKHPDYPLEHF